MEVQEATAEAGQEEGDGDSTSDDAPELAMGWRLNDRFMATFAAVLQERAVAAEAAGITDDGPHIATVDALLAMAHGYRPAGMEDGIEAAEDLDQWLDEEGEVDEDLEAVQQGAREALQRLSEAMGGPVEAVARAAAERALEEVMAVQTERYEEAEAAGEEAPQVWVPVLSAADAAADEGEAEWEEEEEEEEEGGISGAAVEMSEAVPPEMAAMALRHMLNSQPGAGPMYIADLESEYEDVAAVGKQAGASIAVAELEAEGEQGESEARTKGRGRASGGRPRKSAR